MRIAGEADHAAHILGAVVDAHHTRDHHEWEFVANPYAFIKHSTTRKVTPLDDAIHDLALAQKNALRAVFEDSVTTANFVFRINDRNDSFLFNNIRRTTICVCKQEYGAHCLFFIPEASNPNGLFGAPERINCVPRVRRRARPGCLEDLNRIIFPLKPEVGVRCVRLLESVIADNLERVFDALDADVLIHVHRVVCRVVKLDLQEAEAWHHCAIVTCSVHIVRLCVRLLFDGAHQTSHDVCCFITSIRVHCVEVDCHFALAKLIFNRLHKLRKHIHRQHRLFLRACQRQQIVIPLFVVVERHVVECRLVNVRPVAVRLFEELFGAAVQVCKRVEIIVFVVELIHLVHCLFLGV